MTSILKSLIHPQVGGECGKAEICINRTLLQTCLKSFAKRLQYRSVNT